MGAYTEGERKGGLKKFKQTSLLYWEHKEISALLLVVICMKAYYTPLFRLQLELPLAVAQRIELNRLKWIDFGSRCRANVVKPADRILFL